MGNSTSGLLNLWSREVVAAPENPKGLAQRAYREQLVADNVELDVSNVVKTSWNLFALPVVKQNTKSWK